MDRAAEQIEHVTKRRRWRRRLLVLVGMLFLYLAAAYAAIPWLWEIYIAKHPSFDDNPRITQTRDGHPGDPLNVALIGSQEQVVQIIAAAGWYPVEPLGLVGDLKIAADTVLSRPDVEAPVSRLYLFGRQEDLAFEQPVGNNPRQRHHVRLWRTDEAGPQGRPMWIGAASYDARVGLSHTTGQITHHIAADVDAEREHLFADLEQTGRLSAVYFVDDYHTTREGRNGGGDRWFTDGRLRVGIIAHQ